MLNKKTKRKKKKNNKKKTKKYSCDLKKKSNCQQIRPVNKNIVVFDNCQMYYH